MCVVGVDSRVPMPCPPPHLVPCSQSGGATSLRTCRPDDTLRQVLDVFAATRVQRLIGVDDERRPIGIVSLSDIFSHFTAHSHAESAPEVEATGTNGQAQMEDGGGE